MTDIDPGDYDIGDLVRVAFGNPLDALALADTKPDEPAIVEQLRAPTAEELAVMEKLASDAAIAQDKLKEAAGTLAADLKKLKAQLKEQMIRFGMSEITINGRPPIELTSSSSRKPTRKAIIAVLQKQLGDKEGKMKALNLWNKIEPTVSQSVKIPDPSPPEVESPY